MGKVRFKLRFWELAFQREAARKGRSVNISKIAREIGVTRTTLYKYADEELTTLDAGVIAGLLVYLGLEPAELDRLIFFVGLPEPKPIELKEKVSERIGG